MSKYKHSNLDIVMSNTLQSVGYCFLNIFRATKILTIRQMVNYDGYMSELKDQWNTDVLTTQTVEDYGYKKYPYISEFVQSVPFGEMIALSKGGAKAHIAMSDLGAYLQACVFVSCVLNDMVLKDHYKFNREMRQAFFEQGLRENFRLWRTGDLSRNLIRRYFIEDYGFDIVKGAYVSKGGA